MSIFFIVFGTAFAAAIVALLLMNFMIDRF